MLEADVHGAREYCTARFWHLIEVPQRRIASRCAQRIDEGHAAVGTWPLLSPIDSGNELVEERGNERC